MRFFIRINPSSITDVQVKFWNGQPMDAAVAEDNMVYLTNPAAHERLTEIHSRTKHAWIIGDPVFSPEARLSDDLETCGMHELLSRLNGHYRIIIYDSIRHHLRVATSLFSILPVYYAEAGHVICVSDDPRLLTSLTGRDKINKRFILENILFYYPLFNHTVFEDIFLLPTHTTLHVAAGNTRLERHTEISDWFTATPVSWKRSADQLSSLFLERVRLYIPTEHFIHALTGGFDSRTLVACSMYHRADFDVYGFGNRYSDDIHLGKEVARKLDLQFHDISLDDGYIEYESLKDARSFVEGAYGSAGFARAHYLYAARQLSADTRYLITGNFGSEIFRAAHNAGAVISLNMYRLFESPSLDKAFVAIEHSNEFNWLNRSAFRKEWSSLKSDIMGHPVFSSAYKSLSLNQRFYILVMEESFRKYFGAEMQSQSRYLNNRTPFLDNTFLKAIFNTGFAGVYAEFRENNPVKRFKGQVLYAHIIRKAFPSMGNIQTNKGYKPDDLLTLAGKGRIALSYFRKRIIGHSDADPNSVDRCTMHHLSNLRSNPVDASIFNKDRLEKSIINGDHSHDFIIALSQAWYTRHVTEKVLNQF